MFGASPARRQYYGAVAAVRPRLPIAFRRKSPRCRPLLSCSVSCRLKRRYREEIHRASAARRKGKPTAVNAERSAMARHKENGVVPASAGCDRGEAPQGEENDPALAERNERGKEGFPGSPSATPLFRADPRRLALGSRARSGCGASLWTSGRLELRVGHAPHGRETREEAAG